MQHKRMGARSEGRELRGRNPFISVVLYCAFSAAGCDGTEPTPVRTLQQRLTLDQARVMGFEAPSVDWSSNNGPIALSDDATQGLASLSIVVNGYTQISSVNISAPGAPRTEATIDVKLMQQLPWGEARLIVVVPSQGHYWRDLGGVNIATLTPGVFHSLSFAIPSDLKSALESSADDLSFKVVLNGPAGAGFLLDNLVVSDSPPEEGPSEDHFTEETFSITAIEGQPTSQMLLSASESIVFDDRVTLGQPTGLVGVAHTGSGPFEFGAGVVGHANVWSTGDPNFLRSQSQIYGSLMASGTIQTQDNVTIHGGASTGVAIETRTLEWIVDWPITAVQDVALPPDAPEYELLPGAYGTVQISSRATLKLSAGEYYISSFTVEPEANIRLDATEGMIRVYTKNTLRLNASLALLGDTSPGDVLFGHLGSQTPLFQEAISASVVAPHAVIELRRPSNGAAHRGSFYGKGIHVFSDATVLYHPSRLFNILEPPQEAQGRPPVPPPTLSASSVGEFIDWHSESAVNQVPLARAEIKANTGDDAIGAALIAEFQSHRELNYIRSGIALDMLGLLRSDVGNAFFRDLVDESTPTDPEDIAPLRYYQVIAVRSLAYDPAPSSRQFILSTIANHPIPVVRVKAAKAFAFNRGPSSVVMVRDLLPEEDRLAFDVPTNLNLDGRTYDERLQEFLAAYPDLPQLEPIEEETNE